MIKFITFRIFEALDYLMFHKDVLCTKRLVNYKFNFAVLKLVMFCISFNFAALKLVMFCIFEALQYLMFYKVMPFVDEYKVFANC